MKKSIAITAVLAGVFLFWFGCAPKQEAPAQKAEAQVTAAPAKFIVGLDEQFPPMGFRDEKGNIVGFDVDLAKEAAKRMGLEAVFQPIDWKSKELELNSKKIDAIWNGLTITEERKKNMAFSRPYLKNRQVIITAAGSKIKGKADLAGKRIGTQEGSAGMMLSRLIKH
jgi:polar amino acid transport system substrate-binding protein